jgi:hypothetical protein
MNARPELLELWDRAAEDSTSLSPDDRRRFIWLISEIFVMYEGHYVTYQRGYVSEDAWHALLPEQVAEMAAYIGSERQSDAPFNLAVGANTSGNPEKDRERARALEQAGANWWLDGTLTPFEDLDALTARLRAGPPRSDLSSPSPSLTPPKAT